MAHIQLEILRIHNMYHRTFIGIIGAVCIQPADGKGISHFQLGIAGHSFSDQHRDGNIVMSRKCAGGHIHNILIWRNAFHNGGHDAAAGIDGCLAYQYRKSVILIHQ